MDGTVPAEYNVDVKSGFASFDVVTATMQKQTQDDSQLTAQIVVDGQVKKEQSTTANFGVVSIDWSTTE